MPGATPTTVSGDVRVKGSGAAAETAEPEALVVSHYFDSGRHGAPYTATVRLTGRRVGTQGPARQQDTFVREDTVDGILPGSGPVSVTSWVYGLEPGEWTVAAELIRPGADGRPGRRVADEPIAVASWSWRRWAVSPGRQHALRTRWAMLAPLAAIPGVIPGSFTALSLVGILVALFVQAALLARANAPVGTSLAVSLISIVLGLIGAKLWYAILHPGPWRQAILGGWAVDGFLVVASVVAVVIAVAWQLPVGRYLDATAPGIFFAVAIGRIGCFLTGCCAGRCTRSRWGVWSSDRKVGARRLPTQLLESGAGLLIGAVATLLVVSEAIPVEGAVFTAAVGMYLLVRQMLLRLRAERRDYLWQRSELRVT